MACCILLTCRVESVELAAWRAAFFGPDVHMCVQLVHNRTPTLSTPPPLTTTTKPPQVQVGLECGVAAESFTAWQEGDAISCYKLVTKSQRLEEAKAATVADLPAVPSPV